MSVAEQAKLKRPFDLVRGELSKVEGILQGLVHEFDPGVEPYVSHVCNTGGKHLRPVLVVLAGGATGGVTEEHVKLGAILELIHMATLVHDDIIDSAKTRRNIPTPNAKWGVGIAVLLGDALFSHALKLSTDFNDLHLSRAIAQASQTVCEGEILQTQRRFDLSLTKKNYLKIIEMKTAALFSTSTELAAYLSEADKQTQVALQQYGLLLGTAYQIYDDCLDLVGNEEETGKTMQTDLEKGKLTLPLLHLLETASVEQRKKLERRIIEQKSLDLPVLVGIAEYDGALSYSLEKAALLNKEAREKLTTLPDSTYREALHDISYYLDSLLSKLA